MNKIRACIYIYIYISKIENYISLRSLDHQQFSIFDTYIYTYIYIYIYNIIMEYHK